MTEDKALIRKVLEGSYLFKSLDEEGRVELQKAGKIVRAKENEIIMKEGSPGDSFYLVLSGNVSVTTTKDNNLLNLADLGSGSIIGEVALLTGQPRTATVITNEPSVFVKFEEPEIHEILGSYPKVKELLARVLVHRAKDTIEKRLRENE